MVLLRCHLFYRPTDILSLGVEIEAFQQLPKLLSSDLGKIHMVVKRVRGVADYQLSGKR